MSFPGDYWTQQRAGWMDNGEAARKKGASKTSADDSLAPLCLVSFVCASLCFVLLLLKWNLQQFPKLALHFTALLNQQQVHALNR